MESIQCICVSVRSSLPSSLPPSRVFPHVDIMIELQNRYNMRFLQFTTHDAYIMRDTSSVVSGVSVVSVVSVWGVMSDERSHRLHGNTR